jgi:hypothetical protein
LLEAFAMATKPGFAVVKGLVKADTLEAIYESVFTAVAEAPTDQIPGSQRKKSLCVLCAFVVKKKLRGRDSLLRVIL